MCATTVELAERGGSELTRATAFLEHELPGLTRPEICVWIQAEVDAGWNTPRSPGRTAFALDLDQGRSWRIHVQEVDFEYSLVHELVHARLSEDWDPLPAALEEGLCDLMAVRRSGSPRERFGRIAAMVSTPPREAILTYRTQGAEGALDNTLTLRFAALEAAADRSRLSPQQILSEREGRRERLKLEDLEYLYGLGYLIVERIVERHGIESLHQMCRRAVLQQRALLAPQEILRAAGLDSDAQILEAAEVEMAKFVPEFLFEGGYLQAALQQLCRDEEVRCATVDEFLQVHQPGLRLGDSTEQLLQDFPGKSGWLQGHWPAIRAGAGPSLEELMPESVGP